MLPKHLLNLNQGYRGAQVLAFQLLLLLVMIMRVIVKNWAYSNNNN
jgi:hypothetical protein